MLLYVPQAFAQQPDSIIRQDNMVYRIDTTKKDTTGKITIKKLPVYHSPKKAAALSAILPGAGQIYNKKWWKLPIIYGGAAALAYSLQFNNSRYVKYRDAYKYRIDGDASTVDAFPQFTDDNLQTLYQYYHRYRDLTVIGCAALYLLNVVDAAVDAHLFTFDVSDDLSMSIHPTLINTAGSNRYRSGIGLSIRF